MGVSVGVTVGIGVGVEVGVGVGVAVGDGVAVGTWVSGGTCIEALGWAVAVGRPGPMIGPILSPNSSMTALVS